MFRILLSLFLAFSLSAQPNPKLETELAAKVVFLADIKMFTVYALINYTGYDGEASREFHRVRSAIRADLTAKNMKIKYPDFYQTHRYPTKRYISAVWRLGPAPEFSGNPGRNFEDLPDAMRDFYAAADIPALYAKYLPEYEKEIVKLRDATLPAMVKTNVMLKVNPNNVIPSEITLNLLESSASACSGFYNGTFKVEVGPSGDENAMAMSHEYSHGVIQPLLDKHKNLVDKNAFAFPFMKDQPICKNYTSWGALVGESFVRAISLRVSKDPDEAIKRVKNQTGQGFLMTEYIFIRLPEFETFSGSLEDFVVKLLEEFDLKSISGTKNPKTNVITFRYNRALAPGDVRGQTYDCGGCNAPTTVCNTSRVYRVKDPLWAKFAALIQFRYLPIDFSVIMVILFM